MRAGAAGLVAALVAAGCATSTFGGAVAAPAVDAPERFLVVAPGGGEPRVPAAGEGCRSPLVDPRDGTRLRMARSSGELADYEVPAGRYGVGEGELLRVECATGRARGVVPR